MINCVIVEDEFPAREELKYFISKYDKINLVEEFDNPIDALKFFEKNKVDVVFLDINMPNLDGMNLAKIISKLQKDLKIIFITAYREYALDAFEVRAFDYLLKPYSDARIQNLLERIVNLKDNEISLSPKEHNKINKVTVMQDDKMFVISILDIVYIEVQDKESIIYTTKAQKYFSKFKLSKWEEILKNYNFYRTHRSYIVNLDKIIEVEPWFNGTYILKLVNTDFKVPVSRTNVKEFKELLIIK